MALNSSATAGRSNAAAGATDGRTYGRAATAAARSPSFFTANTRLLTA